jgi:hypothetical protein
MLWDSACFFDEFTIAAIIEMNRCFSDESTIAVLIEMKIEICWPFLRTQGCVTSNTVSNYPILSFLNLTVFP